MVIRFTSTLTDEDEARLAPALMKALGALLAPFSISYSIRIETTAGDVVEDGRAAARLDPWLPQSSSDRVTSNSDRKRW